MGSPETEAAKALANANFWAAFFLMITRVSVFGGFLVFLYKCWLGYLKGQLDKAKENSVGAVAIERITNEMAGMREDIRDLDEAFKQLSRDLILRGLHNQKLQP